MIAEPVCLWATNIGRAFYDVVDVYYGGRSEGLVELEFSRAKGTAELLLCSCKCTPAAKSYILGAASLSFPSFAFCFYEGVSGCSLAATLCCFAEAYFFFVPGALILDGNYIVSGKQNQDRF